MVVGLVVVVVQQASFEHVVAAQVEVELRPRR